MTARDIELSLAIWMFPYWKWTVVPRTYTVVPHECDLLALTAAGYAHEVEIKVSLADVKADLKKEHAHGDPDNPRRSSVGIQRQVHDRALCDVSLLAGEAESSRVG